jgi:nitric oxide reductase NorD protein
MDNIIFYADKLSGSSTSVDFNDYSKTIESLLTGLNGRPLKVETSEEIYTDTETIYLPERISSQNSQEENFQLIKASAVHLWAQTYYGTWRISKDDFNNYENKERAIQAYHLLETIRLDEKIKKELPGVGRIYEKLNPKKNLINISKNFKKAISVLSDDSASNNDSLRLIDLILDDMDKVPISLYAGNLKLESVVSVSEERKNEDKINFEKSLEELHEQWREVENKPEETNENENSSEKTFSVKKENDDNEYDVALEFGDTNIKPPENMKKIMDSIIQDFGEIPEEYLEPAGDGGYDSNQKMMKLKIIMRIQIMNLLIMNGIMQNKNILKIGASSMYQQ